VLAGVADYSAHHFEATHRSDPQARMPARPPMPARARAAGAPAAQRAAAAEAGFDLQLSGHTHGGQFWPWNLVRASAAALHRRIAPLAGLWVYTSRGTGYWGPPKRLGAPSEITHLRLVAA
jgi:uncharacterized protein